MSAEAQRRLILHMSVSLDGFVARRGGVIDWLAAGRSGVDHGDRRHYANLEMLGQIGLIVLGRGAFEEMAPAWSTSDSAMARVLTARASSTSTGSPCTPSRSAMGSRSCTACASRSASS